MEARQAAVGVGRRRAAAAFIYLTVLLDVLALGIVAPRMSCARGAEVPARLMRLHLCAAADVEEEEALAA